MSNNCTNENPKTALLVIKIVTFTGKLYGEMSRYLRNYYLELERK